MFQKATLYWLVSLVAVVSSRRVGVLKRKRLAVEVAVEEAVVQFAGAAEAVPSICEQ